MNKQQYQEYLRGEHWKELRGRKHRRVAKTEGKSRCAICGSTERVQTHHLQYKNIYDVLTSDLRILCDRCHGLAHELLKAGRVVGIETCTTHHGLFSVTKTAVKKALGLTGKNLFYPK